MRMAGGAYVPPIRGSPRHLSCHPRCLALEVIIR